MQSERISLWTPLYILKRTQNGHHLTVNILKCIFLNENVWILIKISLKFGPRGPINNILALVQIMAWYRPGDKPLYSLLTHICVTQPQWDKLKPWVILFIHSWHCSYPHIYTEHDSITVGKLRNKLWRSKITWDRGVLEAYPTLQRPQPILYMYCTWLVSWGPSQ